MKIAVYLLVALLVFGGFLVVYAPASFVLGSAADEVNRAVPDLAVGNLDGSVWRGEGTLQYRNLPPTSVTWSLEPQPLVSGQAVADFRLSADSLAAVGDISVDDTGGRIRVPKATAGSDYINVLTRPQGLDLSGDFRLENADISFDTTWVRAATGRLSWPGGPVYIELPQAIISSTLPPLTGDISLDGDVLVLDVRSGDVEMMLLRLKPSGWIEIGINHAFLATAGMRLSGDGSYSTAGDPAILLEEKIF